METSEITMVLGRVFDVPQSLILILGLLLVSGGVFIRLSAYLSMSPNLWLTRGSLAAILTGFALEGGLIAGKVYFVW